MIQFSCCNFQGSVYIFCHKSPKCSLCNGIEVVHYSGLNLKFLDTLISVQVLSTCLMICVLLKALQNFPRFWVIYELYMKNSVYWSWGPLPLRSGFPVAVSLPWPLMTGCSWSPFLCLHLALAGLAAHSSSGRQGDERATSCWYCPRLPLCPQPAFLSASPLLRLRWGTKPNVSCKSYTCVVAFIKMFGKTYFSILLFWLAPIILSSFNFILIEALISFSIILLRTDARITAL